MEKTFVTFFPRSENIHLIKDVGMIPYILMQKFGYKSKIVGCKTDISDMPYLNDLVKGLEYEKIPYKHGKIIDGILYLIKNAKKIDILQLYHITSRENLWWTFAYKLFNHKGIVYLKLDADYELFDNFKYDRKGIKGKIIRYIVSEIDLISAETKSLCNEIKNRWGLDVKYITNGFYDYGNRTDTKYDEKEEVILTVGRIGTRQKNTEELLEAFAEIKDIFPSWKLRLVGSVEEEFKQYTDNYFDKYPELRDRVIFTGQISDRKKLEKEYKKAKIFIMTSRWEGFAIVYAEALKSGCYIVSSNINGIYELTHDQKYGKIYEIEDKSGLVEILKKLLGNELIMREKCQEAQQFVYENYYWVKICGKLDEYLRLIK